MGSPPRARPLWVAALRSRLLVNVLLVLLAAVAVLTAALGPLLFRAIRQSSVADTLDSAGVAGTAVSVVANVAPGQDAALFEPVVTAILAPVAEARPSVWDPPATWGETTSNVGWAPSRQQDRGELASRVRLAESGCAGLVVTTGRCATRRGEVLVSATDARAAGLAPGDGVTFRISRLTGNIEERLTVVGLYDAATTAAPLTRPGTDVGQDAPATADPLVVSDRVLRSLPLEVRVSSRLTVRQPVDLAGLVLLRASLDDARARLQAQPVTLTLQTGLDAVLERAGAKSQAAQVLVGLTEVQAVGLGLFALAVVLHRIARSRSPEWATGRLLGVPLRRRVAAVFVEPGVAMLVGAPLGLAAAVVAARASVARALRPGTVVEVTRWPVLLAAAVAVLAILVTLVAVSVPSVVRPLAEVVQERAEAQQVGRTGAVAQAVVVLLAATTLYALLSGGVLTGAGSQLGLLAPGLFALALAVLAVRVAVIVVRRVTRRPSRSLVGIVVVRQATRVPTSLNPAVVVAVGMALAVFATQVLALSVRNEERRAAAVNGAATVLRITAEPGVDLRTAVRTADPTGRFAMAAVQRSRTGDDGTGRVLAVDSERLAAVTAWDPAWSGVAGLAPALHPPTTPPIGLRGRQMRVDLGAVAVVPGEPLGGGDIDAISAEPGLVVVVDDGRTWRTVRLGRPASERRLSAPVACAAGCRLVGIGLTSPSLDPYQARLTVTGVSTDEQPVSASRAWLRDAGRWHSRVGNIHTPIPDALAVPTTSDRGLELAVSDTQGGAEALAAPDDVRDPLPAVLGPRTDATARPGVKDTVFGRGLDGDTQQLLVLGRAAVLPRLLGDGVLVDLGLATGLSDPSGDQAVDQVWVAPGAPPGLEPALVAAGLRVDGHDELADATATQLREPTTRGAAVSVSLALAGLLLSLLTLVAARVADARRRRADWGSLRDAGLGLRTVRGLVAVESGGPALLGVVLGAVSGVVALVLSAPRLPVVDLTAAGPPLDLRVAWGSVAAVTVASVVAVGLVAVAGALLEVRADAGSRR